MLLKENELSKIVNLEEVLVLDKVFDFQISN